MKKVCSKCGVEKEIAEFSKDKAQKSGYRPSCKQCVKEYKKKYYLSNKNKIKEYQQKNKEKIKQYRESYGKQYYEKNKEVLLEKQREYKRKMYATEEGKAKRKLEKFERRSANKCGAKYTGKEWTSCLEFFNNCDAYTGEPLNGDVSVDHIIPIKAGGTNNINNLVPCKRSINSSKGSKDWLEWYKKQPFYSKKRENKINKWISINSQISFFNY